jgi:hypothetical protein
MSAWSATRTYRRDLPAAAPPRTAAAAAARRPGPEDVGKGFQLPQQQWTRRSGTLAGFAPTPSYRWSSRLLVLAARGPGRGSRRLPQAWPSSSATTSTVDRALPSPVVRRLASRIWQGRLVSQADLYPGVPSSSLLRARRWACPLCTSLTHSQPGLADGPIRGSLGSWASRKACTYARSWSIRACT